MKDLGASPGPVGQGHEGEEGEAQEGPERDRPDLTGPRWDSAF